MSSLHQADVVGEQRCMAAHPALERRRNCSRDMRSCRTTLGNTGFFICNHTIKCNKSRYSQAAMGSILNGLVTCLLSNFVSQHILHLGSARTL